MQAYLILRDFRHKTNKKGEAYGWPVSVYSTPEQLWGYEWISMAYKERPEESREKVFEQVRQNFPHASQEEILKVLG